MRCPWGLPAVTEQEPYGADGEPFPTTYYLTCRHLVAAVSRLEAVGGVDRWSARLDEDAALRLELERATAEQVRVRKGLAAGETGADAGASLELGIGGSRNPAALKCLHAHVAFALARPGYRLGELVLAELPDRWPATCCTTAAVVTTVASARLQWAEGRGRFVAAVRDAARADALYRQRDAVLEELHRRVGAVFTLAELAEVYDGAERWLHRVVGERAAPNGWARTLSIASDAAFDVYSVGAKDYEP